MGMRQAVEAITEAQRILGRELIHLEDQRGLMLDAILHAINTGDDETLKFVKRLCDRLLERQRRLSAIMAAANEADALMGDALGELEAGKVSEQKKTQTSKCDIRKV